MISYPTPKINIGLHVLRKREDGFHDIETLFYPVGAFRDELEIVPSDTFKIEIEGADWDPQSDLTAKAWRLLAEERGIGPVAIRVRKGIPVGAGLGGGSSDCAFALKMLNELFSLGLSTVELEQYAARLGADCAFFIRNIPQWGSGKGDILRPAEIDLSNYEIRVELPEGVHVRTADAYKGLTPHEPAIALREAVTRPVSEWRDCVVNDFEASVFPGHPGIAALKKRMYADGAIFASMSGSGAAVFGLFPK
ncbi:MAG: 4-(cytidine 5'-diphospho)-2-C-methyl-D-erythritol kinase [Bacteroidales bacterium]|nr:4-(cytidine 5'-diphospho)-2-C-methyl-D-erythritol kinase [Bacteroidales bacterium]